MGILLILMSLFPVKVESPNPRKAMVYSAILPGGGQFYTGEYAKGLVFAGVELFLLGSAYMNYRESQKFKIHSFERDFYVREAISYSLYFLGVYLFSIADAYVSANLHGVKRYFNKEKKDKRE